MVKLGTTLEVALPLKMAAPCWISTSPSLRFVQVCPGCDCRLPVGCYQAQVRLWMLTYCSVWNHISVNELKLNLDKYVCFE